MPRPMLTDAPADVSRRSDLLAVGLFALLLFGYAAVGGRPLTMHEARLPETSREMLARHDLLLPTSGGRPWLERPPLPHWFVMAAMAVTGHVDRVWVVRLPSAAMGAVGVACAAWVGGRAFGRTAGLLGGLALATSFEFYAYATVAEDDVYLAALVAVAMVLFVRGTESDGPPRWRPFGWRAWPVWAFFAVAGLSNWAKGPLLGLAYIGSTVGACLLWDALVRRRWGGLGRFTWAWGLLLMLALTVAWPVWAWHHYPDVVQNWKYDYVGRVGGAYADINQPWWYYAVWVPAGTAPWTVFCGIGLLATAATAARSADGTAARLVWCWAIVPVLGLSIPHGKHHHYLVPTIAAWAVLAGVGLREAGRFLLVPRGPAWLRDPAVAVAVVGLPGAAGLAWVHAQLPCPPGVAAALIGVWVGFVGLAVLALRRGSGPLLTGTLLGGIAAAACFVQTYVAAGTDHTLADTAFLNRAAGEVPAGVPLFVDAKLGPVGNLDFFRIQFYLPRTARLLHNLSYLRDEKITAPTVYVVARGPAQQPLEQLGTVQVIDRSPDSHEAVGPAPARTPYGNFTLFRLTFDPHLRRYPAPTTITSLQAMERVETADPGPWCGPPP